MYPRLWAEVFQTVYTFEPDPLNFYVLSLNCQVDNVVKLNAAVGDKSMGSVTRSGPVNVGMHTVADDPGGRVPRMRIDDLGLTRCDYIQLDVEGTEASALAGAMSTLMEHRPLVTVETCDGTVRRLLEGAGYVESSRPMTDTLFIPT